MSPVSMSRGRRGAISASRVYSMFRLVAALPSAAGRTLDAWLVCGASALQALSGSALAIQHSEAASSDGRDNGGAVEARFAALSASAIVIAQLRRKRFVRTASCAAHRSETCV
jgi:hypothetical protein